MSRVKTAVTLHALNKNPSPLGVEASITAPANYHRRYQSRPAMEAKRRKVGDVYPPRGNRFQDKVDPGQQSAAEQCRASTFKNPLEVEILLVHFGRSP